MSEERTKTVIAEDVEIKGTIACTGGIRFEGKLGGDLNCQGIATIGKTAKIEGNITADSATIEGRIAGNVTAKDRIEMKATANVTGDIKAKTRVATPNHFKINSVLEFEIEPFINWLAWGK